MKQTICAILTALLLCLCLLALIMGNITAPGLMRPLMERFAPPEYTGLPAAEYGPVTEMIDGYLSGEREVFQHVYTVEGREYLAFNQKEQQHMADVRGLFRLCNVQIWALVLGAAAAIIFESHMLGELRVMRVFRRTLLLILAALTAVVVLAVIDFDGMFRLFHQLAFTNDLWLLDPRTDMLIRLMPLEFFISYAAIIGGLWLAGMAAMLIFATVRIRKLNANEGE